MNKPWPSSHPACKLLSISSFFLSVCFFTLTPVCGPQCVAEVESPVEITLGVNGQFKEGNWTNVRLKLGPELAQLAPLDIELVASYRSHGRTRPLRRYSTTLQQQHADAPAEISIPVYISGSTNYILTQITKDGRQIFRQGKLLEQTENRWTSFIPILTSRQEKFNIISSLRMDQNVKTVIVSPEDLGNDWTFYEPASCVIIDVVELASLAPRKLDALRTWLFTGGNILFTAEGLESNATSAMLLADAGFKIGGKRRIMSPTALPAFCEEEPDLLSHIDVIEVTAHEADIRLMVEDTPLILCHEMGLGSLWALTFRPDELPLADQRRFDPLQRTLWTSILTNFEFRERALSWQTAIALAPEAEMGNLAGPVAAYLLILLIVLGPVNYVVLRKLDKREYILLTVPVITVALGIGAFIVALTIKGDKAIKVSRTVTVGKAGDAVFDHRQYLGILSPRKARFSLSASDDTGRIPQVVEPITQSWQETDEVGRFPVKIDYLDGRIDVSDVEIPLWGMEFLQLVSSTEYQAGIECSMQLEQDTLAGFVKNNLPFDLKDCFIVFRHNKCDLGDFPKNDRKNFEMKVLPPPSLADKRLPGTDKQKARSNIFHETFWAETKLDKARLGLLNHVFRIFREHFEHPVLTGWIESPLHLKTKTADLDEKAMQSNLIMVRLPLFLSGKDEVNVPIGVSARRCLEGRRCSPFALAVSSYEGFEVELDLPFNAHQDFEIENLTVHMTRPPTKEFANVREMEREPTLRVSIFDWADKDWTALEETDHEEMHHEVTGKRDNYVNFPRGLIRLRAELTDAGALRDNGFSGKDLLSLYTGSSDFDAEEMSALLAFDAVPLILLDVSLKGHFSEGRQTSDDSAN